MKRSSDGQPVCIVCGDQQQPAPQSQRQQQKPLNPAVAQGDIAPLKELHTDRDTAVDLLGEYLLKGWVMLNECCADCRVPLVRTRDRTVEQCVMCNYERQLNAAAATPGTVANAEPPIIAPTITTVSTLPPSNAPAAPVLSNCNNSLINDLNEKLTGLQSRLRKAHELLEIQSTAEAIASIALAIQRLQQISQ